MTASWPLWGHNIFPPPASRRGPCPHSWGTNENARPGRDNVQSKKRSR